MLELTLRGPSATTWGSPPGSCSPSCCLVCANCGKRGHTLRYCTEAITSIGIVCFRQRDGGLEYLMVRRKDSLCYVEFLRGKYQLEDVQYLTRMFTLMTDEERSRVLELPFEDLWASLWAEKGVLRYQKEFYESRGKFNALREGVGAPNGCTTNLSGIIALCSQALREPEWGFPKGRRNISETDMQCALREFGEECNLDAESVRVLHLPPHREVFRAMNGTNYRHVYYLAEYLGGDRDWGSLSRTQQREIGSVAWFPYEECVERISQRNPQRLELVADVHALLTKFVALRERVRQLWQESGMARPPENVRTLET
jgi:8-oxo-dGTP pyrophosphatase MutT (NUDIX family)